MIPRGGWRSWTGLFLGIAVTLAAAACSRGTPTGSADEAADGLLLRLNAVDNDGRTRRFPSVPIPVFLNGTAEESEITPWTAASGGAVAFTFVSGDPGNGITFRLQDDLGSRTCGLTIWRRGPNVIQRSEIVLNPQLYRSGRCRRTPTHEVGHAIGIFGHTSDGGLMDVDGGNGEITPAVAEMVRRLYTMPPGTPVLLARPPSTALRRFPDGSTGIIVDSVR